MRTRYAAAACALAWACAPKPGPSPGSAREHAVFDAGRIRGVSFEAGGRVLPEELAPVADLGANWISETPFGWCRDPHAPEVALATEAGMMWGETDAGLTETAELARSLGIRTLLKPHLWIRGGVWCGDIEMRSEADWSRWLEAYERFIVHYAELAQSRRFDALAIGNELPKCSLRTADWRRLVQRVRSIYSGPLTYCANWGEDVARFELWGDLDFIGVNAYWPLSKEERPSREDIAGAWSGIAADLEALSRRFDRRIVFTEAGYRSVRGALVEPWSAKAGSDIDGDLQADAWRALFDVFAPKRWFGGVFVWKWQGHPRHPERLERDYSPQGKPALEVIRAAYHGMMTMPGG